MRSLGVVVALAACGDDGLSPAPPTISAGPVTIDTATMTLTLGSQEPGPGLIARTTSARRAKVGAA